VRLVEKPLTVNAGQARLLVALAESNNLLLLEAMWTRFLPHMARIREIIAAGTLGDVRSLIADHTQSLPDDPDHRINSLALGGGALLDLGIYPVSFASALFGRPETILASATFKDTGADAQIATIFRYPGGQIASLLSASDAKGPNTASILGTEGRIDIDAVWYSPTSFRVVNSANELIESYETPAIVGRGMHFQAVEAERLVAAGLITSELLTVAESVQIMETLDEIRAQIGLVYPGE
jgi:predicted dehydrogenase